jgi:surfactin synthase thioesterase subunit
MKVALRGLVPVGRSSVLERSGTANVSARATFAVSATRAADTEAIIDVEETDLVEWEHEGVVQWRPVALFAESARRRGVTSEVVTIDLPSSAFDRANSASALSIVRVDDAVRIEDIDTALIQETLASAGDFSRLRSFDDALVSSAPSDAPKLILVHGFASSTAGSFYHWERSDVVRRALSARYGELLCFDHRTLVDSPVDNAIALARALASRSPAARYELVGYSRGGLVAELLARDAQPSDAIDSLMRSKHAAEWPALREKLVELAQLQRRLSISKVLRVASPFAGTFLAGELPHAALSLMLGALLKLTQVPPVAAAGTKQVLLKLLTMVAHRSLPGLFDMRPGSALVRFLDAAPRRASTVHRAVSAAVQADTDSLWQRPAQWAIEHVYGGATDLVVPERSALSGVRNDERLCLPGSRSHFDCFDEQPAAYDDLDSRPPSTALAALLDSTLERTSSIGPYSRIVANAPVDERSTRTISDVVRQRLRGVRVVIVPGIMGSTLDDPSGRVWLSPTLLHGSFARLAYNGQPDLVRSTGLVEPAYAMLKATLSSMGATVIDAHYDWREPIEHCAKQVNDRCGDLSSGRWAIIAHSMGGVVARRWLLDLKREGAAALSTLNRVLFLGVPHRGAYSAALARAGEEGLVRLLDCADQAQNLESIVRTIKQFPGLRALEPIDGAGADVVDDVKREVSALAALQQQFAREFSDGRFVTVLGDPKQKTARSRTPGDDDVGHGDNRVLHSSSKINGDPCVCYPVGHGTIPQAPGFLWNVATLVNEGKEPHVRGALSNERMSARSALQTLPVIDDESAQIAAITGADFATIRDVNAFGAQPPMLTSSGDSQSPLSAAERAKSVGLSVVYGSIRSVQIERSEQSGLTEDSDRPAMARALVIARVEQPVLDGVLRDLDVLLDGSMGRRFVLSGVSAELGVTHSFAGRRSGVPLVVFGLGRMVEFDREAFVGAARAAFERAAFDAVDEALAMGRKDDPSAPTDIELCSVIPSALSATSVERVGAIAVALIEALLLANRGLVRANVRIASFVLYEQHRDSAAVLLRALDAARRSVRVEFSGAERIEVAETLHRGEGYRGSRLSRAAALVDVVTVSIRATTAGTNTVFDFAYDDGRAALRTDRGELSSARRAQLFDHASKGRAEEARDLLAEVVPQWFERLATSGRDLELVLDVESAAIPWEVVADGLGPRRANMVRRFSGSHERVATVTSNTALVVADPYLDAPTWSLAGARTEGRAVASALIEAQLVVRHEIAVTGDEARRALVAVQRGSVRILHIAAHGDFSARAGAGVVLLGANNVLDARWWARLERVPEVVFFNSCSSGRIAPELQQGIASLAESVLRSGVRLFVAAAWPVSDRGAAAFAVALHRELLSGVPFAEAVRRARVVLRATDERTTTWAAYQTYGDPSYRLQQESPLPERYVHDDERTDAALTLIGDLRSRPVEQRGALRAEFDALCAASAGRTSGALLYHLGMCAMDFNETSRAIEYLSDAVQREDAPLSARVWWIEARTRAAFRERAADWSVIEKDANDNATLLATSGMHASLGHLYLRRVATAVTDRQSDIDRAVAQLWRASEGNDALAARVAREARVIELVSGRVSGRKEPLLRGGASVTHRIARAHDGLLRALSEGTTSDSAVIGRVASGYRSAVAMRAGENWLEFVRLWFACVAAIARSHGHASAAGVERLAAQWERARP